MGMLAIPSIIVVAGLIASATSQAADSSPAVSYLPSVSDLMIATIQPRHERLWQAQHQAQLGIRGLRAPQSSWRI
jgi:hypothetical protein